jgi:hypothetical protein
LQALYTIILQVMSLLGFAGTEASSVFRIRMFLGLPDPDPLVRG